MLNFDFNVEISKVGSNFLFPNFFYPNFFFTKFFPNFFSSIFFPKIHFIQFFSIFFFHKTFSQSCHRRVDVKLSLSTICRYQPHPIPTHQLTLLKTPRTSQHQCFQKRYAGISPHERYQPNPAQPPSSLDLSDTIPHPINLTLLQSLEHHSINVPKSHMQGFAPMSDINLFLIDPIPTSYHFHPI